jgi:hypothetical protein
MSTIRSPFSGWLVARFFTWIALGDVDLCFSLILVTNANAVQGGTTSAT